MFASRYPICPPASPDQRAAGRLARRCGARLRPTVRHAQPAGPAHAPRLGNAKSKEDIDLYQPTEFRALRGLFFAQNVLAAGYTAICAPGDAGQISLSVRNAINFGLFDGPRVTAAGRYITSRLSLHSRVWRRSCTGCLSSSVFTWTNPDLSKLAPLFGSAEHRTNQADPMIALRQALDQILCFQHRHPHRCSQPRRRSLR